MSDTRDWSNWSWHRTKDFLVWIPEELQQYTDTDPYELALWNDDKRQEFEMILDCFEFLLPATIECDYDLNTEYYIHPETDEHWKDLCDCDWEYCTACFARPEDYGYVPIRDFDVSTIRLDNWQWFKGRKEVAEMVFRDEVSSTEKQFESDEEYNGAHWCIDGSKINYTFWYNVRALLERCDIWDFRFMFPRSCK